MGIYTELPVCVHTTFSLCQELLNWGVKEEIYVRDSFNRSISFATPICRYEVGQHLCRDPSVRANQDPDGCQRNALALLKGFSV